MTDNDLSTRGLLTVTIIFFALGIGGLMTGQIGLPFICFCLSLVFGLFGLTEVLRK